MLKPDFESEGVQLFRGDCLEFMRGMADKSVDAVITDPTTKGQKNERV